MHDRNQVAAKTHLYFSIFIIGLYVAIGLMLIFVFGFLQIQPVNRIAAGMVLILYAVYRTFKLVRNLKHNRDSSSMNQENEKS